jgi:hypothetical protein
MEVLTQRRRYFLVPAGRKGSGWLTSVSEGAVFGEDGRELADCEVADVDEESGVVSVVADMPLLVRVRFGVWGDVFVPVGRRVCNGICSVLFEDREVIVLEFGLAACLAKAIAAIC